jgi:hypothetical protein
MAESSWRLGVYSWSCCYVRLRWDGFNIRVHTVRCVWASTVTSLHARLIWPPLHEVLVSAMLIRLWEAPECALPGTRVFAPGQQERRDGQLGGEILHAHANHREEK